MIRNIVFDFGKVLVDYDFNTFLRSIISDPVERGKFARVTCSKEFLDICDKGDKSFKELIAGLQEQYPQWRSQLQYFHDHQLDCITEEMPGMRDIIGRLKAKGYGIYGLTNWSETIYAVIEKYNILSLMDHRLVSSEEKLIKPDTAIYHRLCQKFGLKEEECLFTDDKIANVEGAIASGMQAVQFTNAANFEKELKALNLL